jgi:hypothetical protein
MAQSACRTVNTQWPDGNSSSADVRISVPKSGSRTIAPETLTGSSPKTMRDALMG